jgi:hypothetical protein
MSFRKTGDAPALALTLAIIVLCVLALGGWANNVIQLIGMLGGEVTAFFLARLAGVFIPPLGVVLGFF